MTDYYIPCYNHVATTASHKRESDTFHVKYQIHTHKVAERFPGFLHDENHSMFHFLKSNGTEIIVNVIKVPVASPLPGQDIVLPERITWAYLVDSINSTADLTNFFEWMFKLKFCSVE